MLKCNKTLLTSLKEVNSSKKEKKYIQSVDFFYYSSLDRTKNKTPKINETPCMTQFK